ncbi:hypothetical protein [Stackebrandtia nassauensis]|uniref:Uncharacterized protein n=1 Tax=Stackebrandtia nassauensis (strain DSM 44728 / CIP 108903 / NRRL B-16338 / NBRC 102104 / LLR-40K-21) TaxID=446470 RepID=D3Q4J7_STANL|nr:hypothetical protein [Stackebrandtia nassauensis]ADD40157.1 hypothetical protein Snas_0442 [Stackebrandtia nassauensis DSM 44728]
MSNPPQGLGEPVNGAPDMRAPAGPAPRPLYPQYPTTAPPLAPPPLDDEPRDKTKWALLVGLAGVAIIGLVTALFVIPDGPSGGPSPDAAASSDVAIECEPGPAPEGEPLTAERFYEDKVWTNSIDDNVTADRTGRWNHEGCCDVGLGSAQQELNDLGCAYGIEAAYESADGHLGIAQLILAFGDTGAAMAASDMEFTSFRLHEESGVYDDSMEVYGYVEPSGDFLVLTIGSIDSDDSTIVNEAQSTLEAFHVDYASTLPY